MPVLHAPALRGVSTNHAQSDYRQSKPAKEARKSDQENKEALERWLAAREARLTSYRKKLS